MAKNNSNTTGKPISKPQTSGNPHGISTSTRSSDSLKKK